MRQQTHVWLCNLGDEETHEDRNRMLRWAGCKVREHAGEHRRVTAISVAMRSLYASICLTSTARRSSCVCFASNCATPPS